jgi:hypothetical protein
MCLLICNGLFITKRGADTNQEFFSWKKFENTYPPWSMSLVVFILENLVARNKTTLVVQAMERAAAKVQTNSKAATTVCTRASLATLQTGTNDVHTKRNNQQAVLLLKADV